MSTTRPTACLGLELADDIHPGLAGHSPAVGGTGLLQRSMSLSSISDKPPRAYIRPVRKRHKAKRNRKKGKGEPTVGTLLPYTRGRATLIAERLISKKYGRGGEEHEPKVLDWG